MEIKGAIWDFDGTLFDSMPVWKNVLVDYLASCGVGCEFSDLQKCRTMGVLQTAEFCVNQYHLDRTVQSAADDLNRMVEHAYRYEIQPKPNVAELIARFTDNGVKMVIATATCREYIEAALKRCGLDRYFGNVFSCAFEGRSKAFPDIFRQSLDYLGTDRENTLVFEDSFHAVETAKRDGFRVVGVYDPTEQNGTELKKLADYYTIDFLDMRFSEKNGGICVRQSGFDQTQ